LTREAAEPVGATARARAWRVEVELELARAATAAAREGEALEHARQALELARGARAAEAREELARILAGLGDSGEALALLEKEADGVAEVRRLTLRGVLEAELGRAGGLGTLERALALASRRGWPEQAALVRRQLARRLLALSRASDAQAQARAALEADLARGDPRAVAADRLELGRCARALRLPGVAAGHLERARRAAADAGASQLSLAAGIELAELALAEQRWDVALARFRAERSLATAVGDERARLQLALGAARSLRRLGQGPEALATLRAALRRTPTPAPAAADPLFEELADLLAARGDAVGALQAAERAHAMALLRLDRAQQLLGRGPAGARALAEGLRPPWRQVARGLDAGEVLIRLLPTRERLLVWTLDRRGLAVTRVDLPEDRLAASVARLRDALESFQEVRPLARRLYGWLIEPALGERRTRRLIVVATGPLRNLPLAALHDGVDFLGGRYRLSQLPSLAAAAWRSAPMPSPARLRPVSLSRGEDATGPLPFTRNESLALERSFPRTRVLLERDATRQALIQAAGASELLHVASHAIYSAADPLQSSLRLADGELTLEQVLALRLAGGLVVLSACETGVASDREELPGFNEAFLLAGAGVVVSTLARTSDLGTALVMKYFFRHLRRGEDVADALRAAQAEMRERYSHPGFWAAFRVDGIRSTDLRVTR